jgi:hypothetical protein
VSGELGSRWSEPYSVGIGSRQRRRQQLTSDGPHRGPDIAPTDWLLKLDTENRGAEAGWAARGLPADAVPAEVPGVWNTVYPGYSGVAWYECRFAYSTRSNRMRRVVVGGSNYQTDVWLNGEYLGRHEGGYDAFSFRCRQALYDGENRLTLRIVDPPLDGEIDGLSLRTCPTAKESWYGGAGGPWGGVWLEDSGLIWLVDVRVVPDLCGQRLTCRLTFASDLPEPARVNVFTWMQGERRTHALTVPPTGQTATLTHPVRAITRWTPEAPTLYEFKVSFFLDEVTSPTETVNKLIGFRTVELRDGVLHLNGQPRYVKGALLQPTYPRTLIGSPRRRWPADIETAKAAGLNLLRAHLRPPQPSFLKTADRLGMMLYVEPPLAWIEPSGRLPEHGRRELAALVRACGNHPSVVLWGIFNENARATEAAGAALMAELARLDPTRPIIENSGGAAVGEVGMWAWSGQTRCWSPGWDAPRPLNDLHVYLANPLRGEARTLLTALGDGPTVNVTPGRHADERIETRLTSGAVLVSEYGCGALPDFDAGLDVFGEEHGLADAALLRDLRDNLRGGLVERGLNREIGDVSALVLQTQASQAEGIRMQTLALRRNPRVSGLIVTQLADAGWEQMAGLTGLWRHPRPAMQALREALRPRVLHVEPIDPCSTGTSTVRVWLIEEPGLPPLRGTPALTMDVSPGDLTTAVPLVHEGFVDEGQAGPAPSAYPRVGAVRWQTATRIRTVPLRLPLRTGTGRPLTTIAVPLPARSGRYTIRARLTADDWLGTATGAVTRLPDRPTVTGDGLVVLGQTLRRVLPEALTATAPSWRGPILLDPVSRPGVRAVRDAVATVRQGAHLCVVGLDPATVPLLQAATGLSLALHGARGNFMGMHHYRKAHPVFADVGGPGLADGTWAETLPAWALAELPGAEVMAGCFRQPSRPCRTESDGSPSGNCHSGSGAAACWVDICWRCWSGG